MVKKTVIKKKTAMVKTKTVKTKIKKNPTSVDYHDKLIESLKDHDYAAAYLNVAIEESLKGDAESQQLFLIALRNVAEAQGNISGLARRAHIRRETIYRMLSGEGNPHFQSFTSLIQAMGFNIRLY